MNNESGESKIVWVLFVVIVLLVGTIIYGYVYYNDRINDLTDTSTAVIVEETPEATVTPTATTTTSADTIANNVFDLATAQVGDKVGTMTITSIEPFFPKSSDTVSETNAKVQFSGEASITGSYTYNANSPFFGGEILVFTYNQSGITELPLIKGDNIRSIWLTISGQNKEMLGISSQEQSGSATITISNYSLNRGQGEVMSTADLVEVVNK